jgi:PH (Pleckstrin Homology) domain-containing protein
MEKHVVELGDLRQGEKLLLVIHPSPRVLLVPLLALLTFAYTITLIPLAIILAIFIFLYLTSVLTLRYFITTERVIMLKRFPQHARREFALVDIGDLTVVQGLIARSLNYGSIHPQFSTGSDSGKAATVNPHSSQRLRALSQIGRPNEISALLESRTGKQVAKDLG